MVKENSNFFPNLPIRTCLYIYFNVGICVFLKKKKEKKIKLKTFRFKFKQEFLKQQHYMHLAG